jgi:hypothetical protein
MRSTGNHRRRALRLMLALAAIIPSLAIAPCGRTSTNSPGTTSTSTSASSSGGSTATRTALVECLKKRGITSPAHAPSSSTGTRPAGPPPGRIHRRRRRRQLAPPSRVQGLWSERTHRRLRDHDDRVIT